MCMCLVDFRAQIRKNRCGTYDKRRPCIFSNIYPWRFRLVCILNCVLVFFASMDIPDIQRFIIISELFFWFLVSGPPSAKLFPPWIKPLVTPLLSRPQRKFPMKASAPFAFVWNCIQVELYSYLRKGRILFCHPSQLLLNWGSLSSNIITIVNYRQLSLNWSWNIHNCVCGAHIKFVRDVLHFSKFRLKCYTLAIRNAFFS